MHAAMLHGTWRIRRARTDAFQMPRDSGNPCQSAKLAPSLPSITIQRIPGSGSPLVPLSPSPSGLWRALPPASLPHNPAALAPHVPTTPPHPGSPSHSPLPPSRQVTHHARPRFLFLLPDHMACPVPRWRDSAGPEPRRVQARSPLGRPPARCAGSPPALCATRPSAKGHRRKQQPNRSIEERHKGAG